MRSLLIAPHNDDETLFCSHAISRYNSDVLIVFDSFVQVDRGDFNCDFLTRRNESYLAMTELTRDSDARRLIRPDRPLRAKLAFLGIRDSAVPSIREIRDRINEAIGHTEYDQVFAPAEEDGGHDQHNLVACAAGMIFLGGIMRSYLTYTRIRGKSITGENLRADRTKIREVLLSGEEARRKLRALACYRTQINREDCRPHFLRSQGEYLAY